MQLVKSRKHITILQFFTHSIKNIEGVICPCFVSIEGTIFQVGNTR